MTTAIFIDGPLAQEVRMLPEAMPLFRAPLPKRVTICSCSDAHSESENGPDIFDYHCVMRGLGVALYSKHSDPQEVVRALNQWVVTDLNNTDKIYYSCRDRRAFT